MFPLVKPEAWFAVIVAFLGALSVGAAIALEDSIFRKAAIVVLTLAFVAVAIRTLYDPSAPLLGYVYMIPFFNVSREVAALKIGTLTVTPESLFLTLAIGVAYVSAANRPAARDYAANRITRSLLALVLASGLIATFAGPLNNATDVGVAFSLYLDGVLLPVSLVLVLLRLGPLNIGLRPFAAAVVASICIAVALGLTLKIVGIGSFGPSATSSDPVAVAGFLRQEATFTYSSPNDFGLVAGLALPIAFTLSVSSKDVWRLVWLGAFVIILAAAIYTFSRGVFISIALGFLGMAVADKRVRRLTVAMAAAAVAALAVVPVVATVILARFTQAGVLESEPVVDRLRAAEVSLHLIVTQPLGIGGGGFSLQWIRAGFGAPILQSPHDLLLAVAVEYGVVAGVAFTVWLLIVLWNWRTTWRRPETQTLVSLGLAAGALSFLVGATATGWELSHLAGVVPLGTPTHLFVVVMALLVVGSQDRPSGADCAGTVVSSANSVRNV